jgi:CRP/FNR family transcriptional regulator, anaerobic regulatory protein
MSLRSQQSSERIVGQDPGANAASIGQLLTRLHPAVTRYRQPLAARLFGEDERIDSLYVLSSGWAMKCKWLIDGRRQILDFALPGDVLGCVGIRRSTHGAEMLTHGEVVAVPRGLFEALARANPELAMDVCLQLEAAEQRAHEHIASISCRSAHLRVCRLLVELAERQLPAGAPRRDLCLPLPLKQVHIADALGLRIETVCRVLGHLARAGVAHLKSGRLRIADLDELRAEGERETPPSAGAVLPWTPRPAAATPEPMVAAAWLGRVADEPQRSRK